MNYIELKNKMIDRAQTTRLDLSLINLTNDLRFLREDLKISQKELADRLGTTTQKVKSFEGYETRPTLEMLVQVEDFLHTQELKSKRKKGALK